VTSKRKRQRGAVDEALLQLLLKAEQNLPPGKRKGAAYWGAVVDKPGLLENLFLPAHICRAHK
jgi:hypothetical protein